MVGNYISIVNAISPFHKIEAQGQVDFSEHITWRESHMSRCCISPPMTSTGNNFGMCVRVTRANISKMLATRWARSNCVTLPSKISHNPQTNMVIKVTFVVYIKYLAYKVVFLILPLYY